MASRVLLFTLRLFSVGCEFLRQSLHFGRCLIRKRTSLVAENLFLRKQLAAYLERNSKPRRLSDTDRLTLVLLSRCFAWRRALVVVKPETLVGWHRNALRLFRRWKSRGGRPRRYNNSGKPSPVTTDTVGRSAIALVFFRWFWTAAWRPLELLFSRLQFERQKRLPFANG